MQDSAPAGFRVPRSTQVVLAPSNAPRTARNGVALSPAAPARRASPRPPRCIRCNDCAPACLVSVQTRTAGRGSQHSGTRPDSGRARRPGAAAARDRGGRAAEAHHARGVRQPPNVPVERVENGTDTLTRVRTGDLQRRAISRPPTPQPSAPSPPDPPCMLTVSAVGVRGSYLGLANRAVVTRCLRLRGGEARARAHRPASHSFCDVLTIPEVRPPGRTENASCGLRAAECAGDGGAGGWGLGLVFLVSASVAVMLPANGRVAYTWAGVALLLVLTACPALCRLAVETYQVRASFLGLITEHGLCIAAMFR